MSGPQKPINSPSSTNSQAANRYVACYHDQHVHPKKFPNGRPFTGYRELAANRRSADGFISANLQPGEWVGQEDGTQTEEQRQHTLASVWSAPWIPENNGGHAGFWHFDNTRQRITIRYDRILGYDKREFERYYRAANTVANQNGWGGVPYGKHAPYQIVAIIGHAPRHPRIAEAAIAGDPWLLGFVEDWQNTNHELATLLNLNSEGMPFPVEEVAPLVKVGTIVDAGTPGGLDLAAVQEMIAVASAKAVSDALKIRDLEEARRRAESKPAKRSHHKAKASSTTDVTTTEGHVA